MINYNQSELIHENILKVILMRPLLDTRQILTRSMPECFGRGNTTFAACEKRLQRSDERSSSMGEITQGHEQLPSPTNAELLIIRRKRALTSSLLSYS
ncbi:hypothetical protein GWI33_000359 [Rhynchophorus ferrugineus]|uniref:Uncharacterized protein n=1 Tax=Rhynchophorus ferrugineus TaxID=354439 RepID=A0A834MGW0_RHYFE|nr:hypothetical protein GWI33_000359 [Rhynchophorus ferrugineus]